jgi:hypothetical protein
MSMAKEARAAVRTAVAVYKLKVAVAAAKAAKAAVRAAYNARGVRFKAEEILGNAVLELRQRDTEVNTKRKSFTGADEAQEVEICDKALIVTGVDKEGAEDGGIFSDSLSLPLSVRLSPPLAPTSECMEDDDKSINLDSYEDPYSQDDNPNDTSAASITSDDAMSEGGIWSQPIQQQPGSMHAQLFQEGKISSTSGH